VRISNGRRFFRISLISSAIALLAGLPFLVSKANRRNPHQSDRLPRSSPALQFPLHPTYDSATSAPATGLNIVVLDPAHGGTDPALAARKAFAKAICSWI